MNRRICHLRKRIYVFFIRLWSDVGLTHVATMFVCDNRFCTLELICLKLSFSDTKMKVLIPQHPTWLLWETFQRQLILRGEKYSYGPVWPFPEKMPCIGGITVNSHVQVTLLDELHPLYTLMINVKKIINLQELEMHLVASWKQSYRSSKYHHHQINK